MEEKRILVVEDEGIVALDIQKRLQGLGYCVSGIAESGEEAMELIRLSKPDLILMDVVLKGKLDGIESARHILESFDIPIVYLTAYADVETIERAKITGPFGYILKPFETKDLRVAIEIALYNYEMEMALRESRDRLERNLKGAIAVISEIVELKSAFTQGYHHRVAQSASAIAQKMGLSDFQVRGIELAAAVYDIGLTGIPIELLQDAEQLEGTKLALYKGYPTKGYNMLKQIDFPWPIADIILQHCEHFDGAGFPKGIKGKDILIEARILAVAAALGDLTSHRSFRNALTIEAALEEISKQKGTSFDPEVVDACLRIFNEKGYKLSD